MKFSLTVSFSCQNKGNPALIQWQTAHEWTIHRLYKHLAIEGYPIAVGVYKGDRRNKEAFLSGQVIGLDFDDLTPETAKELLEHPFVTQFTAFHYATASHNPEKPRLRLFFILDKAINKVDKFESAVRRLLYHFKMYLPDGACKDAARFFYGNNQPDFAYTQYLGNILSLEEIESLIDPNNIPKMTSQIAGELPLIFIEKLNAAIRFTGKQKGEFLECHCPIHPPDEEPSAHWHPEKHFLYCFHESREYLAKEVGTALGIAMYDNDISRHTDLPTPTLNLYESLAALSLNDDFPQFKLEIVMDFLEKNQYGDALLLMALVDGRILYDHSENIWYWWAGNWWEKDNLSKTPELLYAPLGELYTQKAIEATKFLGELEKDENSSEKRKDELRGIIQSLEKRHKGLRTHGRARDVLKIALGLHGLDGAQWDRNPLLLGVQNGVIDLRTGELRRGKLGDYIRKLASVDYDPKAKAPRWKRFILEIFEGDIETANFIQRLFGYTITGLMNDHILPVFYGRGRNGKDTLVETIGNILGDYASAGTSDLLIEQSAFHGQAQPHIFNLMGKRLVWITETSEGSRLNVNQVKYLTGAGRLVARPLYGNPIEFESTHHIILFTNHKPRVPSANEDYAIWKRLLLIPLSLSFVDSPSAPNERSRDPQLKEKLMAESQGILNWLVEGCLAWQKEGLNPPESIRNATNDYARSEDIIGLFIEECCILNPHAETGAKELKDAFDYWANQSGYPIIGTRKFSERLQTDFEKKRNAKGVIYIGIALQAN